MRQRLPAELIPAGGWPDVGEQRRDVRQRHVQPPHEVVVDHLEGRAVGGGAVDARALAAAEPARPALADGRRAVLVERGVEFGGGDEAFSVLGVEIDALKGARALRRGTARGGAGCGEERRALAALLSEAPGARPSRIRW